MIPSSTQEITDAQKKRFAWRYGKLDRELRHSFHRACKQNRRDRARHSLDELLAFAEATGEIYWYRYFNNSFEGKDLLNEVKRIAGFKEITRPEELRHYLDELDEEINLYAAAEKAHLFFGLPITDFPIVFFKCEVCGDLFTSSDNQEMELCPYCKSHQGIQ